MKISSTPPARAADFDIDGTVPADFPVPDEVLDLIDEASAMADFDVAAEQLAAGHCHDAYLGRFEACRDLALRLSMLVEESGQAGVPAPARRRILERYRHALAGSGWTSPEEACWVIHRMALRLGWSDTLSQPGMALD